MTDNYAYQFVFCTVAALAISGSLGHDAKANESRSLIHRAIPPDPARVGRAMPPSPPSLVPRVAQRPQAAARSAQPSAKPPVAERPQAPPPPDATPPQASHPNPPERTAPSPLSIDTSPSLEQFTTPAATELPSSVQAAQRGEWQSFLAEWTAPNLYHRPLYLEQVNLERYGQGRKHNVTTSVVSVAQFFGSLPLLPYKLGNQPFCQRIYTLGHGRPGTCNPRQLPVPAYPVKGGVMQAATIAGLVFLIP